MKQGLANSGLARYLPILRWAPSYPIGWLRHDAVAGLTLAAVVIPQVIVYSTIIGVPVEAGLYTALVPMLIYAVLGTSRPLSVSGTSTIAILTGTQLFAVVPSNDPAEFMVAASVLALLVGVFLLLASLLRLGFIANFVSMPVLTGFKAGIGIVILVDQLDKVLGIAIVKDGFFQTIGALLMSLNETHLATLALALITLAILFFLPLITRRIPASLVAVVIGILAISFLGLNGRGVASIGTIHAGLPSFSLPDISLVKVLWPGALGIALMSFVESIAVARTFAQRGDAPLNANQELLALGAANIGGSLFQAFPAGGGTSQTATCDKAGARSQLASIFVALTVVLTLLFLAPVISLLPQATVGALIVVVAYGLIKPDDFRAIAKVRTTELYWAVIAFIGVISFGTLQGILVAVLVSMFTLMVQANRPPVYVLGRRKGSNVFRPLRDHPGDETFPGLVILRIEGRMHFASAPRASDRAWEIITKEQPRVVAFECSAIPDFEYTAIMMLTEFEQTLSDSGLTLWLVALNPEALRVIRRAPIGGTLGPERMFSNLELAVEAYQRMEKLA